MKKNELWVILILLLCQTCYGYIYPTINGDRTIWLDREGDIAFTESPFVLGLTDPSVEVMPFEMRFISRDNMLIDISQMTHQYTSEFQYELGINYLDVSGVFYGPGMVLDNIIITGIGELDIYDLYNNGTYMGSISTIPEPMSIFLLSVSILLVRSRDGR